MSRLLLVTVHFRNGSDIERFVAEASALSVPNGWKVDVAVVDNSGDAPRVAGASVFAPGRNLGYAGGAAFGVEQWRAQHDGDLPQWIGIVNADVAFQAGALAALISASLPENVVVVAPSVLLGGISPQNPFLLRRPPAARMWLYTVVFRSSLLTRVSDALLTAKRRFARTGGRAERQQEIYAAHGSVFFLRNRFFERGGTLRYSGFMYGEEIHIAEQARAIGGTVVYMPSVEAIHRGSATTSAVTFGQRRQWHLESARLLWRDYFRRDRSKG